MKPYVGKGSEEYVVKGDGPCLHRTTAAHITGDEEDGPQKARNLNKHLSNYTPWYKEKICGNFPLTITSDQYFDWLQESREAAYKWSSCVDVM